MAMVNSLFEPTALLSAGSGPVSLQPVGNDNIPVLGQNFCPPTQLIAAIASDANVMEDLVPTGIFLMRRSGWD